MISALVLAALINSERSQPLVLDPGLTIRAQNRAEYLCDNEFSHAGWNAWTTGVPGYVGENLAKGFKTSKKTHKALMASPTHRANIVSDRYGRVGIATACGITVEIFASGV